MSKILHAFFLTLCVFILNGCGDGDMNVKKADIGDAKLAYYTRGSGDPLIMIMGFRGTMSGWDPGLLEILEQKHTLILFDNRGVGFSTNDSKNPLTISQMAEDTVKLIKALGYEKVNVLGWSMGSRIAITLGIKHPEVVENLILCSPNPGGTHKVAAKTAGYSVLTSKDMSEKEALSLIYPDTVRGNLASTAFVIRLTTAIFQGTVPDNLDVSQQVIDQQVLALKEWDNDNTIYENLSKIKMPTLVAGGREDVLSPPENVQITSCQIPQAWVAYFTGSGHAFLSQDHEQFGALVNLFIESNKG